MAVPYTFGTATAAIPLSQLDSNFATAITLGNTAMYLGNTTTSVGNLTLTNVTISSGTANVTANITYGTANAVVYSNASNVGTTSANLTFDGTTLTAVNNPVLSGGTANGVAYLNGSKVVTSGSALTFNGTTTLSVSSSLSGASNYMKVINSSNTANSGALLSLQTGGTSGGTAAIEYYNQTTAIYAGATTSYGYYFVGANADGSTPYFVANSTGLGIGTSSPTRNLVVSGGASEGVFQVTNTTSGVGAADGFQLLHFTNGESQIINRENGPILIYTNNTERMRIDSSGNVGIGTSSPSYKLDVNGSAAQARLQSVSAGSNAELIFQSTARTWGIGTNIGINTSFEIYDRTASATRMVINSSGNVGIGTTAPDAKLQVATDIKIESATQGALRFGVAGSSTYAKLEYDDSTGNFNLNNPRTFPIRFLTNNTEQMRLDSSGNLLVGTTSSTYGGLITSNGNIIATGNRIIGINGTGVAAGTFAFRNSVGVQKSAIGSYYNIADEGNIEFLNGTTTNAVLTSSGNLLVGTTSATIGGVTLFSNSFGLRGDYSASYASSISSSSTTGTQYFFNFARNTSPCGSISSTGSNSTTYATSSDYRLKENIHPMTGALEIVSQLKPVTYKWKEDGSDGHGFIAHELQAIVPECVVGEKDAVNVDGNPIYQGVDTSFLVATLTAAIQEQQALIQDLTTRLAKLEAK